MSEITAASDALRKRLRRQEATTLRDVATLHRTAVAELRLALAVAVRDLAGVAAGDASRDAAGRLTEAGMKRLAEQRLRTLLPQAEATYARFAQAAGRTIVTAQIDVVAAAQDDVRRLVLASIGPAPAGAVLPFSVLPQGALLELAGTLSPGSPLRALLDGYGQRVASTIERELIGGIAAGRNPRDVARRIMRQVGSGERARLLTTARTEMLRSHREAMRRAMQANSRIVKGWRWSAARDTRTCLACLAMDGRVFKLERPMPAHVSCRCQLSPITVSWRDLGYDVADLPPPETGRAWFDRQPMAVQRSMLGERAYAAYADGDLDLGAFIAYRLSRQWGSSVTQRPVGQVLGTSRRKAA